MPLKVALLGGSFNPPTIMHGTIATEILRLELVDQVWFVPSNIHPFAATDPSKAKRASYMMRMLMLTWLIGDLRAENPLAQKITVSGVESNFTEPAYTKLIVEELRTQYPNAEFYWILGSDCVVDFPKWAHADWLLENVRFIIYPREGYDPSGAIAPFQKEGNIILEPGAVVTRNVSSTAVRNGDLSGLTPAVREVWETLQKRME